MNTIKDAISQVGPWSGPHEAERRHVDPARRRVRLRAVRYPALRLEDQAASAVDADDAGRAGGAARIASPRKVPRICFALDAGARGIILPIVNISAEAETTIHACRCFPSATAATPGCAAGGASSRFATIASVPSTTSSYRAMIGTDQSLENLDAIASVPGIESCWSARPIFQIELGMPLDYPSDVCRPALRCDRGNRGEARP